MDIETLRAEGISYGGVKLAFEADFEEWTLKRQHSDWTEVVAWGTHVPHVGWMVCKPVPGNRSHPFALANVIDGKMTEEQAVIMLGELGRQATKNAA